ncbi:hypothetical protein AALP_AA2G093300 [Arabis alpina]|uniref:Uncharacterized protein n=1 Tax=Arabis alpina TaxID=50452 RepID=A0A087HGA7_ARAAL|nr:hypothetical protein AALP_AA2G093300 [Arabis alpina]
MVSIYFRSGLYYGFNIKEEVRRRTKQNIKEETNWRR